ncbi:MAG: SET domain-containing protein [Comamonadaceae bacterium]|nr:MAG: SET domain-containing protein [Comamonadaceae bacterium]
MPSKTPTSPLASAPLSAPSPAPAPAQPAAAPRKRSAPKKAPATPHLPAVRTAATEAEPPRPRIEMRRSEVHGNGVFALQDLKAEERVMEYTGEVISWKEALRRHPHDPAQPNHTFYFHIDDKHVIDGGVNGNDAKWINHSCEPNCEADEQGGRIFIKALRDIAAGQELNYDYGLVIDEPYTPALLADFPCWCGSESCRGTLLSPNEDGDVPGHDKQKKKDKKAAKGKDGAKKSKSKDKKKKKKSKKSGATSES